VGLSTTVAFCHNVALVYISMWGLLIVRGSFVFGFVTMWKQYLPWGGVNLG